MCASQNHSKEPKVACHPHPRPHPGFPAVADRTELDPASQALAEALRISFIVLKILMVGIIVLFIWSGAYKVEQNERAIVLRFGKVKGAGGSAIKEPGWKWKWPSPIDEVIKIPDPQAEQTLAIDAFWYYQDPREKSGGRALPAQPQLQFGKDGYLMTASGGANKSASPTLGYRPPGQETENTEPAMDYNIVHTRWRLRYIISDPIVFLEQLWDGTGLLEGKEGWLAVDKFLTNIVSDAAIAVGANRDIDWIVWGNPDRFKEDVKTLSQQHLKKLNVGLEIAALDLVDKIPPRQVIDAFDAASQAYSERSKLETEAESRRKEITSAAEAEAEIMVAQAKGYREKVVQAAKADAEYLTKVLQKINDTVQEKVPDDTADVERKRKAVYDELLALTVDQLYQEMLREVIDKADEVFVLSATEGATVEWRPVLSRDATLKKRTGGQEEKR